MARGAMSRDEVFLQFQWRDRYGLVWTVRFYANPTGFSGVVRSTRVREKGWISIRADGDDAEKQDPMAFVNDVRVDRRIEDRGLGSMLVRESIKECMRRGHKGMQGNLSNADRVRFPKLKHFYEKLGFSVVIYSEDQPSTQSRGAGKIEMVFEDAGHDDCGGRWVGGCD